MAKPKKAKGKKGGDTGKSDEQKDKILEVDKEWYQIQIRLDWYQWSGYKNLTSAVKALL